MTDFIIRAENLAKRYNMKAPGKRSAESVQDLWALKDISFEIPAGAVVGVIGENGAGKSTLLKILSGITEPTCGRAILRGRTASLLEIGAGFHPELNGLENIFLHGAILGMRRREIRDKLDAIIEFSELEPFLAMPVKHYSWGMYLRLAFSVAAHLDSEILLMDEIFAVGDIAFQRKCRSHMDTIAREGRTILLVSQDMGSIARFCGSALLIHKGRLAAFGTANEVIHAYLDSIAVDKPQVSFPVDSACPIQITELRIRDARGRITGELNRDASFVFEVDYAVHTVVVDAYIEVLLERSDGILLCKSADFHGAKRHDKGRYTAKVTFPPSILSEGRYALRAKIARLGKGDYSSFHGVTFHLHESGGPFPKGKDPFSHGGVLTVPVQWQTEEQNGRIHNVRA